MSRSLPAQLNICCKLKLVRYWQRILTSTIKCFGKVKICLWCGSLNITAAYNSNGLSHSAVLNTGKGESSAAI